MRNLLLMMSLCIALPAFADHGALVGGSNAASLTHSMQVVSTLARYQVGNERGHWNAMVLQGEYAPFEWGALRASLPTVRILPDGEGSAVGVGDASFGLRSTVPPASPNDFRWVLALYGTVPTGSESKRIGSGHYELTPMVEMAAPLPEGFSIVGMVGSKFSLGGNHNHEEEVSHEHQELILLPHDHPASPGGSSLYSPHSEKEVEGRIALSGLLDNGYWETGVKAGWGFGETSEMSPLEADIQGGIYLGKGTTFLAGVTQTLSGAVRTPWKINLGLSWTFSKGSELPEAPSGTCGCGPP